MTEPRRGVIFDMDGTLIEPAIDFAAMRQAIGVLDGDILHTIRDMPEDERLRAEAIIAKFEADAAATMTLTPGTQELIDHLQVRQTRCGIITRNTHETIDKMSQVLRHTFEPRIDRTFLPPKPDPAALLHTIELWSMPPSDVIMVGDTAHDLDAAIAAGIDCAILSQSYNQDLRARATWFVEGLNELMHLF